MFKTLVIATGLVSIVALGLMIEGQSQEEVSREPINRSARVIYAQGRVEGTTDSVKLRPQLNKRCRQVLVDAGDVVAAGDILIQLDDRQLRQQVVLREAELAHASAQLSRLENGDRKQVRREMRALHDAKKAELERAQLAWQRVSELRRANAIPQQEADNQRTLVVGLQSEVEAAAARVELSEAPARQDEVDIALANIGAAKANLELAKLALGHASLRAPMGGTILEVAIEPGELCGPDSPRPAVIIANTERLRVRAFVDELDASIVQQGMEAIVKVDGLPGQELHGQVAQLSPRMSNKSIWSDLPTERHDTKTREVWIDLENRPELVIDMRVNVLLTLPKTTKEDSNR